MSRTETAEFSSAEYKALKECDFIRFTFSDIHGISRGRVLPVCELDANLHNGIGFYAGVMVLGPRSENPKIKRTHGFNHTNVMMRPVPGTFRSLVWSGKEKGYTVGELLCESFWLDGTPQGICPRYQARKQLERLSGMGYSLLSSIEAEFYLLNAESGDAVFDCKGCFCNLDFAKYDGFLYQMYDMLKPAGIDIEFLGTEYGQGQFEITLQPKHGIEGADQVFVFKEAVKEICQKQGLQAAFMTKPFLDQTASGFHFNHSIWRTDGSNGFYDDSKPDSLSDVARYWVAGIIAHTPALTALCAPTVNCYRRFHDTQYSVPDVINWSIGSKCSTVSVRTQGPKHTYIENRLPGSAANPYLILAGTLAAGIDGILNQMEPPPANQDTGPLVPHSLEEALDRLEQDQVLTDAFGEEFMDFFLTEKRQVEVKMFDGWDSNDTSPELFRKERKEYLKHM